MAGEKNKEQTFKLKRKFLTDKKLYNVGEDFTTDNADVVTYLKQNGYI